MCYLHCSGIQEREMPWPDLPDTCMACREQQQQVQEAHQQLAEAERQLTVAHHRAEEQTQ